VAVADAFCGNCGHRQGDAAPAGARPGPSHTVYRDPFAGVSPRLASVLCYVPTLGWIASVFCLAASRFKQDSAVRFNAFQGLYLFAAWLVVQWVIHPLSWFSSGGPVPIYRLLELALIGTGIFMMVKASHDEVYVLPIVGELAQRSAAEQSGR
jgi:uncharacterized membrane protein